MERELTVATSRSAWGFQRVLRGGCSVATLLTAIAVTAHAEQTRLPPVVPVGHAITSGPHHGAFKNTCGCGRWTCVICQGGCECELPKPPTLYAPLEPSEQTPSTSPDASPLDQPSVAPQPAIPADVSMPSPSTLASSFGGVGGGPGIPGMIADAFGGGGGTTSIITNITTINTMVTADGFVVDGSLFEPDSPVLIVFDVPGGQNQTDLLSEGLGMDTNGDGITDTIGVAEPVPPTDAPIPSQPGFTYDGGTAVLVAPGNDSPDVYDVNYSYSNQQQIEIILPSPGGPGGGVVVGRVKIAENNSPLPRHRIFVNYSLFDNVPLVRGGVTVNRFSPGFEKTFLNEQASFELRTPFAATLDNNIYTDAPTSMGHLEWGDLFMALKFLLYDSGNFAFSTGMGMTVPIADDVVVRTAAGKPLVSIENESVHLMPYVGWLTRNSRGFFTQGFAQLDLDANGNPVNINASGTGLVGAGRVQDTTYLQLDWGIGYLHQTSRGYRMMPTRIVPTAELHFTRSLSSTDFVETGNFRIGEGKDDIQILNGVLGATFDFQNNMSITAGYVTPIGNGADQVFDGELRAFWNQYY